jgi:hypothetical protein
VAFTALRSLATILVSGVLALAWMAPGGAPSSRRAGVGGADLTPPSSHVGMTRADLEDGVPHRVRDHAASQRRVRRD